MFSVLLDNVNYIVNSHCLSLSVLVMMQQTKTNPIFRPVKHTLYVLQCAKHFTMYAIHLLIVTV